MTRTRDVIDVSKPSDEQQLVDWVRAHDIHDINHMMRLGREVWNDPNFMLMMSTTFRDYLSHRGVDSEQFVATIRQATSVFKHALDKETPQKLWDNADRKHPAVARALRIDPADPNAFYALFPFRLGKVDDEYRILVAMEPPALLSGTYHHIDIEYVLAWNPKTNLCEVGGDPVPHVIGPSEHAASVTGLFSADEINVYGDPFQYFRAWAEIRAAFRERRIEQSNGKWQHPLTEIPGDVPGLLLLGNPYDVRWPVRDLPKVVNCIGCDRKAVTGSIFRSANIPDVVDANPGLEAVA